MAKKKVFISFDYENDKTSKVLIEQWNPNPDYDFYFSDLSSKEINCMSVDQIKTALTPDIDSAIYTVVIVGKEANKKHKESDKIGYTNWLNFEVAKSKANKNKLIGVKIDESYDSPEELLESGASWTMSFTQQSIINALNKA